MKYFVLDEEEQQILKAFEEGKLVSVENGEEENKRYQAIAAATLNKTKNINIRLTEKDLHKVKVKAAEVGIPYQTLVSSIIHRYVNKQESSEL